MIILGAKNGLAKCNVDRKLKIGSFIVFLKKNGYESDRYLYGISFAINE